MGEGNACPHEAATLHCRRLDHERINAVSAESDPQRSHHRVAGPRRSQIAKSVMHPAVNRFRNRYRDTTHFNLVGGGIARQVPFSTGGGEHMHPAGRVDPQSLGRHNATLTVSSDAGQRQQRCGRASGTGKVGSTTAAELFPDPMDFGPGRRGQSAVCQRWSSRSQRRRSGNPRWISPGWCWEATQTVLDQAWTAAIRFERCLTGDSCTVTYRI